MKNNLSHNEKIILYDGVCILCNKWVNFIIKHDKNKTFKFSPLQSKTGRKILKNFNIYDSKFDTIYILNNNKILTKFKASTYALYYVNKNFALLYLLNYIFPKIILNFFYDLIGTRRYKIFGKLQNCPVPHPSVRDRFLND